MLRSSGKKSRSMAIKVCESRPPSIIHANIDDDSEPASVIPDTDIDGKRIHGYNNLLSI